MNHRTTPIILKTLVALFLISCGKKDLQPPPPGNQQSQVRFRTSLPAGATAAKLLVSVVRNDQQPVVTDKMLALQYEGNAWVSERLNLPPGDYKLSKYIILNTASEAVFATPFANSSYAEQVSTPLYQFFSLPPQADRQLTLQAREIQAGDAPGHYGYDEKAFETSDSLAVRVKPALLIGSVLYDSLPVTLHIKTWNAANLVTEQTMELAAGTAEVKLARKAIRYQLSFQKWGAQAQVELMPTYLKAGVLVTVDASLPARKLKKEETYTMEGGQYVATARTEYIYNTAGQLVKVEEYKAKAGQLALDRVELLEYEGSKPVQVKRFNADGSKAGTLSLTYQGFQLVNMHEKTAGHEVYAAVEQTYPEQGPATLTLDYLYSNGSTLQYTRQLTKGNSLREKSISSTGQVVITHNSFDGYINPYVHLKRPDIFLSNSSRSNVVSTEKEYSQATAAFEPYRSDYQYDAMGYPVERIRKYKSTSTGQHAFTTKTVYFY